MLSLKNYGFVIFALLTLLLISGCLNDAVDGTTLTPVAETPQNLALNTRTTSSITMQWDVVPYVDGYRLYRSGAQTGTYEEVASSGDCAANVLTDSDPDLTSGVKYWYKVSSFVGVDESDLSGAVSAIVLTPALTVGTTYTGTVVEGWYDRTHVDVDPGQNVTITLSNFSSSNCDLFVFATEDFNPSIGGSTTFNTVETVTIDAGTYSTLYLNVLNYNATTSYNLLVTQP